MKDLQNDQFRMTMANADDLDDMRLLSETLQIDKEILAYAADKNELSHLEFDKDDNSLLLIYNVLDVSMQGYHYQTFPITFYVVDDTLITIYKNKSAYVMKQMETLFHKNPNHSLYKFLFSVLYLISKNYFPSVERLNQERNRINLLLREKTSKRGLLALSDLETGLVYMVSSSKQNVLLLNQVKALKHHLFFSEEEVEQLDDALIEAKQLVEMTQLSSQIMEQLEGTYNNVLNNELNDTMKILTLLSILLTVPSIITGFFGMNVPLPPSFVKSPIGWLLVIGISVILWFGMALILKVLMDFRKK